MSAARARPPDPRNDDARGQAGERPNSTGQSNVASLPGAATRGNAKTGRTRYLRWFPERLTFMLDQLEPSEFVAAMRLSLQFVIADGALADDNKKLALLTKTGRRWPELRDKLLVLGLARIEAGCWIDDHQQSSLDLQRQYSARGSKGATARWGRHA